MFELGVITDEIDQDLDHTLDVVAEWGLTWVELRTVWGTNIVDLDEDQVDRLHRTVRERGLRVAAIDSPCLKCVLPGFPTAQRGDTFFAAERDYPTHLKLLERAAALAHRFDTPLVRIFSFWAVPDRDAAWPAIVERMAEVVQVAEQGDVTLVLENEHVCNVATGADTRRLVDAVTSPRLRAVWDPGNAYAAGENPYPDGYNQVRNLIAHVHLKDVHRDGSAHGVWRPIGGGDVDLLSTLRALKTDGYSGVASLETHYVPAGGTKEAGSRESFAGLQRLMAQV